MPGYGRRGGEVVANTQLVGSQLSPSIAGFAGGGFILVWSTTDAAQDGAGRAIKAQRYDSLGNAVGPEVLINAAAAGDQRAPSVTTLAGGGYVVTWETTDTTQDGSGLAIKGQVFDAAGAAVGTEFRVNSQLTADQSRSAITGLDGGGFVVTWQSADSAQDGHTSAIKGQIYSAAGVAVGGEFLVNSGAVGGESAPSVTSLAGGGFVATWTLGSGQFADVYAQVFNASGAKSGGQFLVNSTTALNQDSASVTELADGRFVITWSSASSLTTYDTEIRARIFSASGAPIGSDFVVSTTKANPHGGGFVGSTTPQIVDLPDGGFLITWAHGNGDYISSSIRGQYFDAAGARVGSEFLVSTVSNRTESAPDIAVDGNGNMFAVWESANNNFTDYDIRGQVYTTSGAPEIVSNGGGPSAALSVAENQIAVATIAATDPEGSALTYSIVGGIDASRFAINASTGALTFVQARNFESKQDFGANNVYDVIVSVSDGVNTDIQALAVTITNVNESPTLSGGQSSNYYIENGTAPVLDFSAADPDGDAIAYSLSGADAARFTIDADGVLRFAASPNYEARLDAGANNIYDVTVTASDGSLSASYSLSAEILNQNEAPYIVSGGGGDSFATNVAENAGFVMTIVRADPDASPSSVTFSIAGGADASKFSINAQNGQLFFSSARNFEAPSDVGANNVYDVIVSVSDGFNPADTQAISVTVTNVNEAVTITSNGGGASAAVTLVEGGTAVASVSATDLDGTAPTYSIAGGADAALFAIDAATGALRFLSAPDFEAPADAGANNVYNVVVTASDGSLSDSQAIAVTVGNANEDVVLATASAFGVDENIASVGTIAASDPDGAPLSYAIAGGADAASFAVDVATGALRFVAAHDFEAPSDADGDNDYEVVVTVSDGSFTRTQAVTVSVGNAAEGVTITSGGGGDSADVAVAENGLQVTFVAAVDGDGTAPAFAIAGGADAALFAIDAATGALRFLAAPDHEAPGDADGDNVYDVVVSAGDGVFTDSQALAVSVGNANEGVSILSAANVSTAENGNAVTIVEATDADGDTLTYSIAGGADAALFAIDAVTGALSFLDAPNFETPADAGGDNVYDVVVSATDGVFSDSTAFAVSVGNANEGVSIGSAAAVSSVENQTSVMVVVAADADGDALTYSIAGGDDAALFEIDAATGALRFLDAPDFEAPGDADGDNVYDVVVSASDGAFADNQSLSIAVGNANEGVSIASGTSVATSENQSAVMVVAASDADGDAVTFSIAGGADASLFAIDAASGALSFIDAPDFEAPGDAGLDNLYEVIVSASDGTFTDSRAFAVSVGNVNEGVSIGSAATASSAENGTAVTVVAASDVDGDALAFSITGGADAARFTIDAATGALRFVDAPDFEAPADVGGDNVYDVVVSASDGTFSDSQALAVSVGNVNEGVSIGSTSSAAVAENQAAVTVVAASDADGDALTYSISGGADASKFTIDAATGALRFVAAPNYEAPADAGGDNVYDVVVSASDGTFTDSRALAVTVGNVNEGVAIGSASSAAVAENETAVTVVAASDADGDALTYSISGGADAAKFTIDAATGALRFVAAPNYEAPADVGGDNVYDVVVSASDGVFSDSRALAVTVGNANEGVSISSATTIATAENGIAVTIVAASDADGGAVSFAISGGADAARFTIDAVTGALRFVSAPNFEAPTDAGGDNVYDLVVSASDGTFTDSRALSVRVGNVEEGVAITSGGGGASAMILVAENVAAVATVAAVDGDGRTLLYSITGGADAARFTIDAATGALRFLAAPNHEAPADAGGNNVYDVVVSASDGTFTDSQALAVTVTNVREGNIVTGNASNNTISTSTTVTGQPRATELEDTIYGMGGADTIASAGGADVVDGGAGNDTITGGLGADVLTGGTGADRFVYNFASETAVGAHDVITDFSRAEADKISLNAIDANANASGNQNFSFIGMSAFSGVAGQLRYSQADGKTFVSGDVNGDRAADFMIELSGLVSLASTDFIL
ncbi:MAG TPA: hypothetical protein VF577_03895 [Allosphingosinicella sp.]|jgi:Ca2+-binding RTX toxin-like protein